MHAFLRTETLALLTGLALFAGLAGACSDRENRTTESAATLAAKLTAQPRPTATPTSSVIGEPAYRAQVQSLSTQFSSEVVKLSGQLKAPQATQDWIQGVVANISQIEVELDLLRKLQPPSERYVAFDQALDASLDAYNAGVTELNKALTAADTDGIAAAAAKMNAAIDLYKDALKKMPPA